MMQNISENDTSNLPSLLLVCLFCTETSELKFGLLTRIFLKYLLPQKAITNTVNNRLRFLVAVFII